MKAPRVPVALEAGPRRLFAFALDWPGWCRSGRDEGRALEALEAAANRYARVAAAAGVPFIASPPVLEVVERLAGTTTTDFGAPDVVAAGDLQPLGRRRGGAAGAVGGGSLGRLRPGGGWSPGLAAQGPPGRGA